MHSLEGRRVIIFYDDGGSVSKKIGEITDSNEESFTLNDRIIIPKSRIVRIELQ